MRLSILRKEASQWKWTAEHSGMGWIYIGVRDEKRVVVYATSMLCGPNEDDFETVWRVNNGQTNETYAWWITCNNLTSK
jgi:hypothetical protein